MYSYYNKKLSYSKYKDQYYTTTESKTTVLGRIEMKMWVILLLQLFILFNFGEYECKTRVDTTRMESNTLTCNAVLDKKIKICTNTTKHLGNTQPGRRGSSLEMYSYYKKKLSYSKYKLQYSTTSESKRTFLGSIEMTNIQYYANFFDATEIWNVVLFFGSMVATNGNVVLFFTKIRGR